MHKAILLKHPHIKHTRHEDHCHFELLYTRYLGFPGVSPVKNLHVHTVGRDSIPGLGRAPGEGNGNPLHYSCLGNPLDRGAWQVTVHVVAKSQTELSMHKRTTNLKNLEMKKSLG